MTSEPHIGRVIGGDPVVAREAAAEFAALPIDFEWSPDPAPALRRTQRTLAAPVSVQGPGTFFGRATRTLRFEPTEREGWWIDRIDLVDTLPVRVSIRNVWTTGQVVSNIVLRSGSPNNYVRLVEHFIPLRLGADLHNVMIRTDSGDPPLLTRYGREILEALERGGTRDQGRPVKFVTVRERITLAGSRGDFLTLAPTASDRPRLQVDCGVRFTTAIGRQRIRFQLAEEPFRLGSEARTNTTLMKMLYCRTIGMLFADVRNLGYNGENVLIAGRFGYVNRPKLVHAGKSLEAVWHRAALDLLAAIALIDEGVFVGEVISYKAGHRLDMAMIRKLYREDWLVPVTFPDPAPPEAAS